MAERKKPGRNWKEYNERLVRRGEVALDVESLKGWKKELKKGRTAVEKAGEILKKEEIRWTLWSKDKGG